MGRESYGQYLRRMSFAEWLRKLKAQPEEQRTNAAAARVVELWSRRHARGAEPLLVPTIAAAVRAGRPWLSYQCPACQMIGETDVRSFERHPHASIQSLIPLLDCPRCPAGPFVVLIGLAASPAITSRLHLPKRGI